MPNQEPEPASEPSAHTASATEEVEQAAVDRSSSTSDEAEKSTVEGSNSAGSSGSSSSHSSTSSIPNPKSKSQNGKRPYVRKKPFVQTPAQRAASMANMKKAWAAPNEKTYPQRPSARPPSSPTWPTRTQRIASPWSRRWSSWTGRFPRCGGSGWPPHLACVDLVYCPANN